MVMAAISRADAKAAPATCDQAFGAHNGFDPFMIIAVAAFVELVGNAGAAIGASKLDKDAFNKRFAGSFELVASGVGLPSAPGVVGAARQIQGPTEHADRVEWLQVFHSLAALGRVERIAIVFFKISHC